MVLKQIAVEKHPRQTSEQAIPKALIYEILDGQVLYYKGYHYVVRGEKKPEAIMGSSSLQFVIINYFIRLFARELDEDQYYIAASEAGVHIDHQSNLANDIAIYESSVLTPDKINEHYASVAPKIVIEVDIKADLSELQDYDYVQFKTKKLLDFGTELVIWIFSATRRVLVARPDQDWLNQDWDKEAEMLPGLSFNIGAYLKKKGIKLDQVGL